MSIAIYFTALLLYTLLAISLKQMVDINCTSEFFYHYITKLKINNKIIPGVQLVSRLCQIYLIME